MATRKKRARTAKPAPSRKDDIVKMGSKIWLAGLGALARSRSVGPKLFDSLVAEGSVVQTRTRDTTERALKSALDEMRGAIDTGVKQVRGKASEAWDHVEDIFQSRVHKALEQLGVPSAQEVRALTRKVEDLTRSVQGLAATKKPRRARRTTKTRTTSSQPNAAP